MKEHPVGIIGAGRVGVALGKALMRSGYTLIGISARSSASRERAHRALPGIRVLDPPAVAQTSGILLLAVPDDEIKPVATALTMEKQIHKNQYVVHLSGAHGLAILHPATTVEAHPLAIHPAMTFPGFDTDADHLDGLAYAVTAHPDHRPQAERFVRDLGGVPVWVTEDNRPLYHAALALGANNLIALVASAIQALTAAGIDDPGYVLAPLVRTSLENALHKGDHALTGPICRADIGAIDAHIRVLRERVPELVTAYIHYGLVTAQRAQRASLNDAHRLDKVIALFENSQ